VDLVVLGYGMSLGVVRGEGQTDQKGGKMVFSRKCLGAIEAKDTSGGVSPSAASGIQHFRSTSAIV
jgi:hypothetical protein